VQAELALQRCEGDLTLLDDRDGGEFYRIVVLVGDPALQCESLCHHLDGGKEAYYKGE